jgi:hypothetical protein
MNKYGSVYTLNKYGLKSPGFGIKLTRRNPSKSVKCGRGGFPVMINRPGHEADRLHPLSFEVKNNYLMVVENRLLRKTFEPKRDEVTGEWRRLHNEELLFTKYYSGDQIKKNKMGGACSTYVEKKRCIQGYGGKT